MVYICAPRFVLWTRQRVRSPAGFRITAIVGWRPDDGPRVGLSEQVGAVRGRLRARLELFDGLWPTLRLTLADGRWAGPRRREIARAGEVVCDFLVADNVYAWTAAGIDAYFFTFAVAARRKRQPKDRVTG